MLRLAGKSLKGKTIFITGASRGIGRSIALRAARDGARLALAAKSIEEDERLGGTIYSVASEVERAGGTALPLQVDVRQEKQVEKAMQRTFETFGSIDVVVNNAGALFLGGTTTTPLKRFDLLMEVNVRAAFLTAQKSFPYLKNVENAHIVNLSPPLDLDPRWFKDHVAYSISKYGMSLCVLGMAEEFRKYGISVNALWPRYAIATAAVRNLLGGDDAIRRCRKPEIMSDAFYELVTSESLDVTGQFLIDEDFLRSRGVQDFEQYAVEPGQTLLHDLFV
jgi:citronellol/citronellal dehydrogenase